MTSFDLESDVEKTKKEKKTKKRKQIVIFIVPLIILVLCVVILAVLVNTFNTGDITPTSGQNVESPTHIIYLLADDLGYNDVGWHDEALITPHLSEMAENGVRFGNFYTMTSCSPSRVALMTGRYASNVGGQHYVYMGDRPHGAPRMLPLLPQKLKDLGYATYGVGKWHLGFCNDTYMPTNRGFDRFFGFLNGGIKFYEHTCSENGPDASGEMDGKDLRDGLQRAGGPGIDNVYTSELFEEKLIEYIRGHDPEVPMFLYLAYQQPHTPRTVPQKWEDLYPYIEDSNRRIYAGQVTLMDSMAGTVFDELKAAGMYNDSLIIFHSDNGGDVLTSASNWPYRGNKGTYFDGGIKSPGFVAGKGIQKTGYKNKGLFHISDMYPTLIESVAGGILEDDLDGINIWESLSKGEPSPREEMLITVDEKFANVTGIFGANVSAIRYNEWKLIVGWPAFSYTYEEHGWYLPPYLDGEHQEIPSPQQNHTDFYLFNLTADPYETTNLEAMYPDVVQDLNSRIDKYRETAKYFWPDPDPAANPDYFDGYWSPGWC